MPLREMFEKVGVMKHPDSKIEWKNGKVDLCIAYYVNDAEDYEANKSLSNGNDIITIISNHAIEIGNSSIIVNTAPNLAGQNISREMIMNNAPVLKGGNTYIPYSYINYMLKNENWNIGYAVYDTEGNIFALTSYPIYDENISGIPAK